MDDKKFESYLKLCHRCKCEACKMMTDMITDEFLNVFNFKKDGLK